MEEKQLTEIVDVEQRLRELEEENKKLKRKTLELYEQNENMQKQNSYSYSIDQDLKTYNSIKTITFEDQKKEEELKTLSDYKEEARQEELQKRNSFLFESLIGSTPNTLYKPGDNSRYYQELAFLNVYESSEESFKKIVAEKMELLKECKYWDLLEQDIEEDRVMDQFFRGMNESNTQKFSESKQKLNTLARNIMIKMNNVF